MTVVERLRLSANPECWEAADEIERLHAEIEVRKTAAEKVYLEQAAEIERLRADCKGWYDQNVNLIEQRDKVWEENKSLRSNNERLRAEMDQRMAAYVEYQERDEAEIGRLRAQLAGLIEKGMDDLTMVAAFQVNEELRADNERLRAALDRAADALEFYDNKAEAQKARRELEAK